MACPHNVEHCIKHGGSVCSPAYTLPGGRVSYALLGGSLGGLFIFLIGMAQVYRQREQRHMRERVRSLVVRAWNDKQRRGAAPEKF